MPRFHFHLRDGKNLDRDDEGSTFPDIERAYLDAHKAARDMSMDMLKARQDPHRYGFDITDSGGRLLLELPFTEALRMGNERANPALPFGVRRQIEISMERSRTLKVEILREIEVARRTVEVTRVLLGQPAPASVW